MIHSSSEDNYRWFQNNLQSFLPLYEDQFLVIHNECIVGAEDSFEEALDYAISEIKLEPGSFLVQLCSDDEEKLVHKFYTPRVSFDGLTKIL